MTTDAWSEVPPELLSLICDHLELAQLHRFGAVCRAWRSAVTHHRSLLRCRRRTLQPTPNRDECIKPPPTISAARFLSLSEERHYAVDDGPFGHRLSIGSAFGWLITTNDYRMCLLDPIARRRISLPAFPLRDNSTLVFRYNFFLGSTDCTEVVSYTKATLSSSPDDGEGDYMVLVAVRFPDRLVYARRGDRTWTSVRVACAICDVMCRRRNIYTLSEDGRIVRWDFSDPSNRAPCMPTTVLTLAAINTGYNRPSYGYMVDPPCGSSSGNILLLVLRYDGTGKRKKIFDNGLITILVKVDLEKQEVVEVESIGEHAIFVGLNAPICLSSLDFPWLERNCIYIADNKALEVHSMEERGVRYLAPLADAYSEWPLPLWFTPSIA